MIITYLLPLRFSCKINHNMAGYTADSNGLSEHYFWLCVLPVTRAMHHRYKYWEFMWMIYGNVSLLFLYPIYFKMWYILDKHLLSIWTKHFSQARDIILYHYLHVPKNTIYVSFIKVFLTPCKIFLEKLKGN